MERNEGPVKIIEVKKGGFLGKFVAFLLGLLIGIIGIIGAIVGVGYWATTQPITTVVDTLKMNDLIFGTSNTAGMLNKDYIGNMTIGQFIGDVIPKVTNTNEPNYLENLVKISPIVEPNVDNILNTMETNYGLKVDKKGLYAQSASGLPTFLTDSIYDADLGTILMKNGSSNDAELFIALCYGEEDVDFEYVSDSYTGADAIKINGKNAKLISSRKPLTLRKLTSNEEDGGIMNTFYELPLATVLKDESHLDDSIMCAIAYGHKSHYEIVREVVDGKTVKKAVMKQVAYTLEGDKLYDISDVEIENYTLDKATNVLTLESGEKQYLRLDSASGTLKGTLKAYKDAQYTDPVKYTKTKISELTGDAASLVDGIYLKDAMEMDDDTHKILKSLAEDKDGNPRTIGELKAKNENIINDISLTDVMKEERDDKLVMYLLYGKKGIHYDEVNGEIDMLQRQIAVLDGQVYNEYGEEIVGVAANGVFTDANGETYDYAATNKELDVTVNGVAKKAPTYYLSKDGEKVLYHATNLGDLNSDNSPVSHLTTRLQIADIFTEKDIADNMFLVHVQNETIDSLPSAIEELKITEVYAEEIFEDDGVTVKGTWWYLLYDQDTGNILEPTIKEMASLTGNMMNNVHAATLNQLDADGMVDFKDSTTLTRPIDFNDPSHNLGAVLNIDYTIPTVNGIPKETLGELTVSELLEYVDAIVKATPKLPTAP